MKLNFNSVLVTGAAGFIGYHLSERLLKEGHSVTGIDITHEEMLKAGERIWNLERMFNMKAGFTKEDDILPKRLTEDPAPLGPPTGQVVELEKMLGEYYELRGWDENGVPTEEKLKELGII